MQGYKKTYLKHFNYGDQSYIPCENCGGPCADVHHLDGRGKGKDVIENLMGLCRECHNLAHDNPAFNEELKKIHLNRLRPGEGL